MIRFKIKNVEKTSKEAQKLIEEAIRDPKFLAEVGKKVTSNIKQDLLQGRDPETSEKHKNQLKASTVKQRERLSKHNQTDKLYKKKRPLVFTGQLVRSIIFRIKKGKPIIEIGAKGFHFPYKNSRGKYSGKPIENQKLLEIHHKGDGQKIRRMVGISEKRLPSLLAIARNQLRRILSKK